MCTRQGFRAGGLLLLLSSMLGCIPMAYAAVKSNIASENSPPLSAHRRLMSRKLAGINAGQFPKVSYACMQCFAKCPFTGQFDRLSYQLCQSLDRLSDQFAKHWGHAAHRPV